MNLIDYLRLWSAVGERPLKEVLLVGTRPPTQREIEQGKTFELEAQAYLALSLWQRWWEWSGGEPWQVPDGYGRTRCFFCVAEHPSHEKDCMYLEVKQLMACEKEQNEST